MNPDELCICGHTYEVHFGHDCSQLFHNGKPCPCKEFALCDAAVDIYEALKAAHIELFGLSAYLETCSADVIVDNLPMLVASLRRKQDQAEAAIRKAKGE